MSYEQKNNHFSVVLFLEVNLATLALIFGSIKLLFPALWVSQLTASWMLILGLFVVSQLCHAFIEYFFHRYVLHANIIPFFKHFYDAHTFHHSLTSIEQRIVTSNHFPITEEPQHESSFFPWWTVLAFSLMLTPLYIVIWLLLPTLPIFLVGYASVLFSVTLYEIFHMALHLPMSFWMRRFNSRLTGKFWRLAYTFHLRHHANVSCNESISGFFGIPIPDFLFGTYVQAQTLFPDQTVVPLTEYKSPQPGLFIRTLDRLLIKR